ncbi:MAG: hypothetical protein WBK55_06075 [Alphaproteobacteria bacterium]
MNEKNGKKFVTLLLPAMALLGITGMIGSYILDPFQIFHTSWLTQDRYLTSYERFQNAGLIAGMKEREDCCETIIIGTSHSQNFIPSHVAKAFRSNGVLQLSMPGPLASEQEITHKKASESKEIKNVIWDIHDPFAGNVIVPPNDPAELRKKPDRLFPLFLYDENRLNDYLLLASADLFVRFTEQIFKGKPYDVSRSWYFEAKNSFGKGRELGLTDTFFIPKHVPESYESHKFPNIDEIIIPAVVNHPEQKFFIFFPPYSKHFYATMTQEEFSQLMAMRLILARKLAKHPNAQLFSFDGWKDTENLDNYKDLGHYSAEMSRRIIESMAAGKNRLRGRDAARNIGDLTGDVNAYITRFESDAGKE